MSSLGPAGWLLFVEDPGAVNYFIPLVDELESRCMPYRIYAAGHAMALLAQRGITLFKASLDSVEDFLDHPSLVVVGTSENPDTLAFDFIAWAKKHGVHSVAIVDSGVNAAHRFRGRTAEPLFHAPDYLLVPDDWSADEYTKLGFERGRLFVVGHPMQDRVRIKEPRDVVRARVLPPHVLDRFVLVFVSEISTGLNPQQYQKSESYTLHGRGMSTLRTGIVVEELLDAVDGLEVEGVERPYMILRRHPKETEQDLKDLAQEFDAVSMAGDPLELVYAAGLVVGMSSILLNEAHLLGAKTLAVVPRAEEMGWLPSVRNGDIPSAVDRPSLRKALTRFLSEYKTERGGGHSVLTVSERIIFDPMKYLISISRPVE